MNHADGDRRSVAIEPRYGGIPHVNGNGDEKSLRKVNMQTARCLNLVGRPRKEIGSFLTKNNYNFPRRRR